ncbi:MAG: hypothetical protein AAF211_26845, partial [Myxococcota bacterium]
SRSGSSVGGGEERRKHGKRRHKESEGSSARDRSRSPLRSQIAAAVLVAGHGVEAVAQAGCAIARVPLWVFHGDTDSVVDVAGAVEAMAALTDCPNPDRRRLTLYEGVDHDSWSMTYDGTAGHDIYDWMAGFSRRAGGENPP